MNKSYVVMIDVRNEHGKRKVLFPKEIYEDKSRAEDVARSLNGRNKGDHVVFAYVTEANYYPNTKYSINNF